MNFLKRLELQGFKSFAQKTVLEFPSHSRIIAIVGPNGSGKSNIIDAFRWALGERGAKQLRGDKLENLIFAGTPKRPASSLAKVTLYFDNQKNLFPVDMKEAVLTRRIDKSGTSQFFWNNVEVRLKDLITDLAKVRLGTRGLIIINQGESDIFVKSNPQERRLMIEEVLGLREFRLKKIQAENRLQSSQINLDKVKVILEELMPHLRLLRKQKNRWGKRFEIEKELKTLEDNYFSFFWSQWQESLDQLEKPLQEIENKITSKQKEVSKLEAEFQEIKKLDYDLQESKRLKSEVEALLNRRSVLEKELGRLEVKVEMTQQNQNTVLANDQIEVSNLVQIIDDLKKDLESWLNWDEISKIKNHLKQWIKRLNKFSASGSDRPVEALNSNNEFKLEIGKVTKQLQDIEGQLERLTQAQEKQSTDQQKFNYKFREMIEVLEANKNEARRLSEERQKLLFEQERSNLKLDDLRRQFESVGRSSSELSGLAKKISVDKIDEASSEKIMLRLRGELAAIGEIDSSLMKEVEESEERYQFLSQEIKDLEKASIDLRKMIRDLEGKIHGDFQKYFRAINEEFNTYFRLMFGGGRARLHLKFPAPVNKSDDPLAEAESDIEEDQENKKELIAGVEIEVNIPRKKIKGLSMLSGGEKSLVSMAALFALIAVSPPPFLVLDEIDATLDEVNAQRFAELVKEFSHKTQFIIVTHNRVTMEAAEVLYGITMGDDGVSKVLSLKLEKEKP